MGNRESWSTPDEADSGCLPQSCHVVIPGLPAGTNVGVCVRGLEGVRLTRLDFGDTQQARRAVRAINRSAGVSALEEHAMLAGAMLGWTSWMADPAYLACHDRRFWMELPSSAAPVFH